MNLSPLPIQKFFSNNGRPLVGGKLFTYVAGTTTKIATYTDSSGVTQNTNPIILDFRGECRLWIDPHLAYKFVLSPPNDTDPPTNPIWTVDDITVAPVGIDYEAVAGGTANAITLTIPRLSSPVAFTRILFKASSTNTGPVTISINGGPARNVTWQNLGIFAGGELQANGFYEAIYDGLQWQLQGPTLLPPLMRTDAEIAAGVVPTNYYYPEGHIDRYGTNTTPGGTDMTNAVQAAINVAHQHNLLSFTPGAFVYGRASTYRLTSPIVFPLESANIKFFCEKGAQLLVTHNGNGIDWIALNENFSGHVIEGWTITGPNQFLPGSGYIPPSNGSGINMNRNATTNAVTAYNNVIRDCVIQGFNVGINMQAVIGLNVFGSYIQYNQYGVYVDGGQTNANHFHGTHIRYNRKNGIRSQGTTGGSLTNATANTFHGCLIESNIPYPFVSGGTPPTDSVAIYLNNSYQWIFIGCYSENHSASIYLTGGSKGNKFIAHRCAPGTGRVDAVYLDGGGIYNNSFELHFDSASLTEVNVISNNADQQFNDFRGTGVNFVAGSVLAKLDYNDIKPSLVFANTNGYGLIRMPSQGYKANVNEGTAPGTITGIGTANATLNVRGIGEMTLGSGITAATTITSINGVVPGQVLVIRNAQSAFLVTLDSTPINGNIGLLGGRDVFFNVSGMVLVLYCTGDGTLKEVGRNFDVTAGVYTVTGTSQDRTLDAADTLAQTINVLGTLINDLKTIGILS